MNAQDNERITRIGVKIEVGKELGRNLELETLLGDFDAVFLGLGLGPDSRFEAAGMQDRNKFWALQDQLFVNQAAWSPPGANHRQLWLDYATKIGLDTARFQSDMAGIAAKTRVDQDLARGKALGVNSTPSIYINNQPVPFPDVNVQSLRRIIDAELQRAASAPANTGTGTNTK